MWMVNAVLFVRDVNTTHDITMTGRYLSHQEIHVSSAPVMSVFPVCAGTVTYRLSVDF